MVLGYSLHHDFFFPHTFIGCLKIPTFLRVLGDVPDLLKPFWKLRLFGEMVPLRTEKFKMRNKNVRITIFWLRRGCIRLFVDSSYSVLRLQCLIGTSQDPLDLRKRESVAGL